MPASGSYIGDSVEDAPGDGAESTSGPGLEGTTMDGASYGVIDEVVGMGVRNLP